MDGWQRLRQTAAWRGGAQLVVSLRERNVVQATSAMAFHAFFSLIPLVAFSGWLGHTLTHSDGFALTPLLSLAPGPVAALADDELMQISATGAAWLAPVSLVGFLWLASGGMATTMRVFEMMFDAPRRSWWHRRLLAVAFVLFAVAVLVLAGAVVLLPMGHDTLCSRIAALLATSLGLWLLVAGFFRFATRRPPARRKHGGRGALVTLLLWFVVSALFGTYVSALGRHSLFYGGLAAVVVLLAWLWLMALALLVGGQLNANIERRERAAAVALAQRDCGLGGDR